MPYANNITQKVESAVAAVLDAATDGLEVHKGITALGRVTPGVIVACQSATADVPFSGNWRASVSVVVRSNADDESEDVHRERAAEVFAVLFAEKGSVITALTAGTTNFTAFALYPRNQRTSISGRCWESILDFDLECCGSTIADS